MGDHAMHGSDTRLVNTQDGVQLEFERNASGSGNVNCHVFVISDTNWKMCSTQYMDPCNIPFNALIVGPTNSGKSRFVVDELYGPFRGKFDYIALS